MLRGVRPWLLVVLVFVALAALLSYFRPIITVVEKVSPASGPATPHP